MRYLIVAALAFALYLTLQRFDFRRVARGIDSAVRGIAKLIAGLLLLGLSGFLGDLADAWLEAVALVGAVPLIAIGALQLTGWIGAGGEESGRNKNPLDAQRR